MYWRLAVGRIKSLGNGLFGSETRKSGVFPLLAMLLVIAVPAAIWYAHRHAEFHNMKSKVMGTEGAGQTAGPRPGGRDPIVLSRTQTIGGTMPEFLSATILPGLGMDVVQITGFLPGRGEVPLLSAPALKLIADGQLPGRTGPNDTLGAIEVPWGGGMAGTASPLGNTLTATWKGRPIILLNDGLALATLSEGGMLRYRDTSAVQVQPDPRGSVASGHFEATDFDEHWPSRTETNVVVRLTATMLELTIDARNVGDQAEPMGIGWHPRFVIQNGARGQAMLRLPMGERLEIGDSRRDLPTGRVVAAGPALESLMGRAGNLGEKTIDEAMVRLKPSVLDSSLSAELRQPSAGYGLRIIAASTSIHELRVFAPAGADVVSLGMQTNYENPLDRVWEHDDAAVVTLQPGQTLQYKVTLEIFPIMKQSLVH